MRNVSLDYNQRNAVLDKSRNILVLAPPGSGKTTVIINRLIYLIKNYNINYNNMIIITFTKAAAENMKNRFISYCKLEKLNCKSSPFFGTFHSLFYRILYKHIENINIITEKESFYAIGNTLSKYINWVNKDMIKEILNNISIFKSNECNLEEFNPKISKDIFYKCYRSYESYKLKNKLMDFDDIQIKCKKLLLNNEEILNDYRRIFKYILVDEFQDCDAMQIEILKLLNKENSLFAVGDEDQCIYGFRGSKPQCMVEFEKHFNQGKKIFLVTNYRSGENIVTLSKNIIENNKLRNNKKIINHNKFKGDIRIKVNEDEKQEVENICKTMDYLLNTKKYQYKDIAILYRRNIESLGIIDSFIKKQIPFKLLEKQFNLYEHFICKDIISYLRLAVHPEDRKSFISIVNKPCRYISKLVLKKLCENRIKDSCFDLLYNENISLIQLKTLKDMERKTNKLSKLPTKNVIKFILNNIGYMDYIDYYVEKFKLNKEDILYIISVLENSLGGFNNIDKFLEHIEKAKQVKENIDAVTLSSIHRVKGMEFKSVFIINCNDGNIPHKKDGVITNLEEERRIFYVGITRAIEDLNIHFCKSINGKCLPPCRFIQEGENDTLNLSEFNVGDSVKHYYLGNGVVENVEKDNITINFTSICRTFNTKILAINNLISKFKNKL